MSCARLSTKSPFKKATVAKIKSPIPKSAIDNNDVICLDDISANASSKEVGKRRDSLRANLRIKPRSALNKRNKVKFAEKRMTPTQGRSALVTKSARSIPSPKTHTAMSVHRSLGVRPSNPRSTVEGGILSRPDNTGQRKQRGNKSPTRGKKIGMFAKENPRKGTGKRPCI